MHGLITENGVWWDKWGVTEEIKIMISVLGVYSERGSDEAKNKWKCTCKTGTCRKHKKRTDAKVAGKDGTPTSSSSSSSSSSNEKSSVTKKTVAKKVGGAAAKKAVVVHTGPATFFCDMCDFSGHTESQIKKHLREKHVQKQRIQERCVSV